MVEAVLGSNRDIYQRLGDLESNLSAGLIQGRPASIVSDRTIRSHPPGEIVDDGGPSTSTAWSRPTAGSKFGFVFEKSLKLPGSTREIINSMSRAQSDIARLGTHTYHLIHSLPFLPYSLTTFLALFTHHLSCLIHSPPFLRLPETQHHYSRSLPDRWQNILTSNQLCLP